MLNKIVCLSVCYTQTALLHSIKSGFTTLVDKRALHIISTPCVLHRCALAN